MPRSWLAAARSDGNQRAVSYRSPWLPALAESVGGRRFNAQGITEAVPIAELMPFKMRFTESPATDFHTRWAQWFFADRATRNPSPYDPVGPGK